MSQRKWTDEQIIGILKHVEGGCTVADVCREYGVGESTYYKWKSKYGGLEVNEARRLNALEDENARLKRIVADQALDVVAGALWAKDALSQSW
jgi:putative transposase